MGDTYYLQSPKKQFYYWMLISTASFLSLGDRRWWGFDKLSRLSLFNSFMVDICVPACFLSQVVYLYVYYTDLNFDVLGTMFVIIPVTGLVAIKVRATKSKIYKKVMMEFMEKIHLYNYQNQTDRLKMVLVKAERYSRWTAYFLTTLLILDGIMWSVIPLINNMSNIDSIRNKTIRMQTSLYMWMPFEYGYDYRKWLITHSINVYFLGGGCSVLFVSDVINYTFIFHLIGHVEVLRHKIRTQFTATLNPDQMRNILIDIIEYHSFILRIFKDVESAFGLNVGANYLLNLVVDSLLLYHLIIGESSHKIPYCFLFLFFIGGLIFMSFVLEEIHRQSDGLADAVYELPWEKMSVSNKKMVLLILTRIQPALVFKATGGINAGVRPMLSIIKSTFSYYVMLKSCI